MTPRYVVVQPGAFGNRSKRFLSDFCALITGLKPGANENDHLMQVDFLQLSR
jgi:hypothetical protein